MVMMKADGEAGEPKKKKKDKDANVNTAHSHEKKTVGDAEAGESVTGKEDSAADG